MYLFAAACLTATFFLGWLLCPGLRRSSLVAAVALAPFAVMGFVFVPAYWQPDHAFTFIRGVGVEDVLFCFACGGVCWVVAASGAAVRCEPLPAPGVFLARLVAWAGIALFGGGVAWWAGCGILAAVILGFVFSGLVVLCRVPRGLRLILPGAVGFSLVYAAVSWLVLAVYPDAAGFWVAEAISGRRVLGLPVEELAWSASFGATWPVVFAFCIRSRFATEDTENTEQDRGVDRKSCSPAPHFVFSSSATPRPIHSPPPASVVASGNQPHLKGRR